MRLGREGSLATPPRKGAHHQTSSMRSDSHIEPAGGPRNHNSSQADSDVLQRLVPEQQQRLQRQQQLVEEPSRGLAPTSQTYGQARPHQEASRGGSIGSWQAAAEASRQPPGGDLAQELREVFGLIWQVHSAALGPSSFQAEGLVQI